MEEIRTHKKQRRAWVTDVSGLLGAYMKRHDFLILTLMVGMLSATQFSFSKEREIAAHGPFQILKDSIEKAADNYDYEGIKHFSVKLLSDTNSMSDPQKAYAFMAGGMAYLYSDSIEKAPALFARSLEMARENTLIPLEARVLNYMAIYEASANDNLYLAYRLLRESRRKTLESGDTRMLASINNNLARLSIELQDTSGEEYALETLKYGEETDNVHYAYAACVNLAHFARLQKRYDKARDYIEKAAEINKANEFGKEGYLHHLLSKIAYQSGNHEEAFAEAEKASSILKNDNPQLLSESYLQMAVLMSDRHEYKESNQYLAKAIDAQKTYDNIIKNTEIYRLQSDNYRRLGDDSKALASLLKAVESMPDKTDEYKQMIFNEWSIAEQLSKTEMEFREQQLRAASRLKVIIALCVVLALSIGFAVYMQVNHRRKLKLHDSIVERDQEIMRLEKEEQVAMHKSRTETDDGDSDDDMTVKKTRYNISDDRASEIFNELTRIMREERLYADATYTRDQLIKRLGTNSSYLAQIIMEKSGMNYPQFVNSFRIKEAIERLSDPESDSLSIKDLSAELGFGSPSSFYKLFQAQTGISPTDYRKSVKRLSSN